MQAGTFRSLVGGEKRTGLMLAMLWLLGNGLFAWLLISLAMHWDDKIDLYAGYLNSRLPAGRMRALWLSSDHISTFFSWLEWFLVWVTVPALILPVAALDTVDGIRLRKLAELKFLKKLIIWIPALIIALLVLIYDRTLILPLLILCMVLFIKADWSRIRSVWCNWRWWPVVFVVAFIVEHLLPKLYDADPHGTTRAQLWAVILKTAAYYLVVVISWLILLIWSAVLLNKSNATGIDYGAEDSLVPVLVGGPDPHKSSAEKLALPD